MIKNWDNVILAPKVRNALKKMFDKDELDIKIKNIDVNGSKRGCSGFVKNNTNGVIVYLNTEDTLSGRHLFCRYAGNMKDFRGIGANMIAKDFNEFIEKVADSLDNEKEYKRVCELEQKRKERYSR